MLYEFNMPRWSLVLTESDLQKIPGYSGQEENYPLIESDIYDNFTPDEIKQIWNRSKALLRSRAFRDRVNKN